MTIWNSTCNPCFSTFDQIFLVFHGLKIFFFYSLKLYFICYLNRFFTFDYSLWDRGRHTFLLAKTNFNWISPICHNHYLVLPPFMIMTYHRVCYNINTTGITCGAGSDYHSGAPQWDSCRSIFCFLCSVLQIIVCPFFLSLYFLSFLWLSVHRWRKSQYQKKLTNLLTFHN